MSSAYLLVGPTAAGKSAVAHWIAERGPYEILSADSMLVYTGMDIGTDKPSAAARSHVTYHGLDLTTPDRAFSVWAYQESAQRSLAAIARRGRRAIVAGGTGLYVKSLTHGLAATRGPDAAARAMWESVLAERGVEALQEALRDRAPALYDALPDKQNARRLVRALEMAEAGPDAAQPTWERLAHGAPMAALSLPAEDLKLRIESRVSAMYQKGLFDEVRSLLQRYGTLSDTARHAIGYAEAIAVLEGRCAENEARRTTAQRTWQLARRQRTWFRHQARVEWLEITAGSDVAETAGRVLAHWQRHGPTELMTAERMEDT